MSAKGGVLGQLGTREQRGPWQSVEVQNEQVATLAFEKSSRAAVTGIVRENGVVLEGASVAFERGAGTNGAAAPQSYVFRTGNPREI